MKPKFAPREIFEVLLEWSVFPAFDLLLEYGDKGVVFVRRKIEPYNDTWALPGLRMYKGEGIDDTIKRIAKQELDLDIDPRKRVFLGQYVGKFKTEHQRQDLSTGYYIKLKGNEELSFNKDHFSNLQVTKTAPSNLGAMYKYYFKVYKKLV